MVLREFTVFWDGFIAVVIIGVILSLIGAVLMMTLGKRYPFVRYLAYVFIKRSNGGQGEWSHSDFVQGKFSYCPMLVGCMQHVYPTIVKHQYRDGTAVAELPDRSK